MGRKATPRKSPRGIATHTASCHRRESAQEGARKRREQVEKQLETSRPAGWNAGPVAKSPYAYAMEGGVLPPARQGVPRINASSKYLVVGNPGESVYDRLHLGGFTTRRSQATSRGDEMTSRGDGTYGGLSTDRSTSAPPSRREEVALVPRPTEHGSEDPRDPMGLSADEFMRVLQLKQQGNGAAAGGRYGDAVELYAEALGLYRGLAGVGLQLSEKVNLLSNQAEGFLQLGEWTRAVLAANDALKLSPGHPKSASRRRTALEMLMTTGFDLRGLAPEEEEELATIRGALERSASGGDTFRPKLSSRSQQLAHKRADGTPVWERLGESAAGRPGGTVQVMPGDDQQRFFRSLRNLRNKSRFEAEQAPLDTLSAHVHKLWLPERSRSASPRRRGAGVQSTRLARLAAGEAVETTFPFERGSTLTQSLQQRRDGVCRREDVCPARLDYVYSGWGYGYGYDGSASRRLCR